MKSYYERINQMALSSDEPIRSRLFEYALLHAELSALTCMESPNEADLTVVLRIIDTADRRRAGIIAARMRRISRSLGATLSD